MDTLTLDEVTKHTFRCVLEYLYTDAIKSVNFLHPQEIENVLLLANQWQLPRLALLCEYYLFERITDDNIAEFLEKPYRTLFAACLDYAAYGYKRLKSNNVRTTQQKKKKNYC